MILFPRKYQQTMGSTMISKWCERILSSGTKLSHQRTAGFSPMFFSEGFHFGCPFLTHSHIFRARGSARPTIPGCPRLSVSRQPHRRATAAGQSFLRVGALLWWFKRGSPRRTEIHFGGCPPKKDTPSSLLLSIMSQTVAKVP